MNGYELDIRIEQTYKASDHDFNNEDLFPRSVMKKMEVAWNPNAQASSSISYEL